MNQEAGRSAAENSVPFWDRQARQWKAIQPPLRPTAPDLQPVWSRLSQLAEAHPPRQVVLFGVTREIRDLPWAAATRLVCCDRSLVMIDLCWGGDLPGHSALCADWMRPSLRPRSFDLAWGDNTLALLPYPAGISAFGEHLARLLRPGGYFVIRTLVPSHEEDTADSILAALWAGQISNISELKVRLVTAMQDRPEEGVELAEVWRHFHRAVPNPSKLAEKFAWDLFDVQAIDAYRDNPTRYYAPEIEQLLSALNDAATAPRFEHVDTLIPDYPAGSRCPTAIFRRLEDT